MRLRAERPALREEPVATITARPSPRETTICTPASHEMARIERNGGKALSRELRRIASSFRSAEKGYDKRRTSPPISSRHAVCALAATFATSSRRTRHRSLLQNYYDEHRDFAIPEAIRLATSSSASECRPATAQRASGARDREESWPSSASRSRGCAS